MKRCLHTFRDGLLLLVLICSGLKTVLAQNLVPNHSFEIYDPCPPPAVGMGGALECQPWIAAGPGTPDYFNRCADPVWRGVPKNFQGYQHAFTGDGYVGVYIFVEGNQYREYVNARLLDTLEEDACYKVSAWVNAANQGCTANQFGILFTSDVPNPLGTNPQVAWAGGQLGDTVSWTNVLGYFIADGTEEYITMGNMAPDSQTEKDPACPGPYAYYYIDEVLVEEVPSEQVNVNLGADVSVCDSFTIVAGDDPNVVYIWNTGHQGPELTVYTSGTYSVTASYACTTDEDEIEVTIIPPVQVDIGPDVIELCVGEVFEISLDPDEGDYEWSDGSDDPEYTISTAGTYSVTVDNGCHQASDTIEVTPIDIPLPFSLGNDTIICDGEVLTISLDPALGIFEWQDGSDDPTYTIDSDGLYSLTVSNECGERTDDILVDVVEPPTVFLGPDTAYLCPNQTIDYEFDPDIGEYVWQDFSTGNSYTISEDGLYSVTVTNECGIDEAEIFVIQNDSPEADLGPDVQGCPGDVFILDPGLFEGEYTWQDGSTSPTFTASTSGVFAVTISNNCGTDSDAVNVSFAPDITPPDLGPDLIICPGDQVTLSVSPTSGNILWNDMSTGETLVVTGGGTYFVQISTVCEFYSDTIVITQNSTGPIVQLPPDFSLCMGDSIILDAGNTGASFLWNDGSVSSQLHVFAPGMYSVTVSNSCGTSIDSIVISAGEAAPTVSLGMDTSMCNGDTIMITPVFTHVDTWVWNDGTSGPQFMATDTGTVSILVGNSCAMAGDTMIIAPLSPAPLLDLGPDAEMCPGESIVLSITHSDVSILWFDGSTDADIQIIDSALVYATISNSCGQSSDTMQVELLPETPVLDLGQDQTICPGELVVYDPGIPGVEYLWHDGSSNTSYQTTQGGTIYLTITGICGASSDTVILTESTDGPQLNLGPDITACDGETVLIPSGISGVQYLWQDGSMQNELSVSVSGAYSLTVSNSCGSDADTVEIIFTPTPPPQLLGPDMTLCEGNTVTLTAVTLPGVDITWQDMSSGPEFIVSQPGTYTVRASNTCGVETDTVIVQYIAGPEPFDLGPDTTLCPGQMVLLSSPSIFYDVLWQDGSEMLHLIADHAGMYWLRLSNTCGVQADTLLIEVIADDPSLALEPELLWCPGDAFILDATQSFDASYLWNTGAVSPTISVNAPGLYSVLVTSLCNSAEGQSNVIPQDVCSTDPVFYIPNVFSPGGDGINDLFVVSTDMPEQVISMQGAIYDRWGNIVHQSGDNPYVWNGHFGEDLMNPGVFVYVIKVRFMTSSGEKEEVFTGDVTLIR